MKHVVVVLAVCCTLVNVPKSSTQVVDLKMDFQTNSVMQLDQASDGTIWGITSSNIDRLPTIAGVWSVRSTNGGISWDTACITDNWWRWGVDIAAQDANTAYAVTMREDTLELYRKVKGSTWVQLNPSTVALDNVMAVHFFNERVGFIIGTQGRKIERKFIVSRTSDGGATWQASLPLLPDPPTEVLADNNDRAVCWKGATVCVGMNTGRILVTHDSAQTWKFIRTPLRSISAITLITENGQQTMSAYHTQADGTVRAFTSSDDKTWTMAPLPPTVKKVYGAREIGEGTWVSIPRSLYNARSVNLQTGEPVPMPPGCDALLAMPGGILCSQELFLGKGLVKIELH